MNSRFLGAVGCLVFTAAALFYSCKKELNNAPTLEMEPYAFTSIDAAAGDWRPILLASNAEVAIPEPEAVASDAYTSELAATKAALAGRTADQEAEIRYWGANAIARWTQIASDLMAKYNLPPAPNADDTYGVPNANTPDQYPYFPFANPPYASRAYAYWGAAQYDALITAWHWKMTYQRPAPFAAGAGYDPFLPKNDLPSYPSEDAVIAAVSRTILSAMFPLEKAHLAALAETHKNTRIWAGMNVASDLAAGDSLGRLVAQKFLARAKSDNMSKALGTAGLADSLANAAQNTYGQHWTSLDLPVRPPMLPGFGNVKTWNIPGGVAAVRPGPPPAVGSAEFTTAANELTYLADNVSAENRKIAFFWSDGPSSYTPPGHWAIFGAQLMYQYQLNPIRSARVMAYLGTALMDAGVSCWDTKYFYHFPRPSSAIPGFKTIIGVPNFPAYTSGHSTFSAAGAAVLSHFFPLETDDLAARAKEASESRIVSGIHYRFDCETGLQVGTAIGNFAVQKAEADGGE